MWPKDLNVDTPYTNDIIQTFQNITIDIPLLILPRSVTTFQHKPRTIKNNECNVNLLRDSSILCDSNPASDTNTVRNND
jgi:hypothetical protein